MNIQHWEDELEIFAGESVLGDGSIVHLWQHKKDDVVFSIKEGYILEEEEDDYGNKFYHIKKR